MQARINDFSKLSEFLDIISRENTKAASEACEKISKSNGTLRSAISNFSPKKKKSNK